FPLWPITWSTRRVHCLTPVAVGARAKEPVHARTETHAQAPACRIDHGMGPWLGWGCAGGAGTAPTAPCRHRCSGRGVTGASVMKGPGPERSREETAT